MIKLKNLWKVALATMAMTAMLVACDDSSSSKDVTPGEYTAGEGVYAFKANKSDIGTTYSNWGGFSILLLKEDQVSASINPQAIGTFAVPTAQITCGSNLTFPKYPAADGNAHVKSGDVELESTWVTVTKETKEGQNDGTFTLYVDMSKITINEVKAFGDGNEIEGDDWLKSGRNLNLAGYKPYIIALFDYDGENKDDHEKQPYKDSYKGECSWGPVGTWKMEAVTATKPTDFGTFLPEPDTSAIDMATTGQVGAKFRIEGSGYAGAAERDMPFENGKATMEFTISADESDSWDNGYFACWHKFYAGDDKTVVKASTQYGAGKTTLGKPIELTTENSYNLEVTDLNKPGTYVITVDATGDKPTITVTEKK